MRRRHPLPRIWLMTDERIDDLEAAIARLPRGSGIVFRHYGTEPKQRRALFDRVRVLARRKRHLVLLADTPQRAWAWRADGAHNRSRLVSRGLRSAAVHSVSERVTALQANADLIFISPVFATQSHPGARSLGRVRLGLIAGANRGRTIALGGMSAQQAETMATLNLHGWAAIDAFRPD